MKRLRVFWLSLVALLSLSACQASPSDLSIDIKNDTQDIILALNYIQKIDDELQKAFNHDVKADQTLAILGKRSSELASNLKERRDAFNHFKQCFDLWQSHVDQLEAQKNQSKEAAYAFADIEPDGKPIKDALTTYSKAYQATLDRQAQFIDEVQADNADFKAFAGGIDDIQNHYADAQAALGSCQEAIENLAQLRIMEEGKASD